jgi:hypothetical protein
MGNPHFQNVIELIQVEAHEVVQCFAFKGLKKRFRESIWLNDELHLIATLNRKLFV